MSKPESAVLLGAVEAGDYRFLEAALKKWPETVRQNGGIRDVFVHTLTVFHIRSSLILKVWHFSSWLLPEEE